LPRPRDYRSPDLLRLVDQLHDLITGHELPDIAATAAAAHTCLEQLPDVMPSQVVGLLEYLDARGGRQDIFQVASDTNQEFGHVISLVEAAEMLDFVDTPKRMVVLAPDGQQFLRANPAERQAIWRNQLLKLRLFSLVHAALLKQPNHRLDRDFVLETLVLHMPQENSARLFETFMRWARFGNLFGYHEDSESITLP
jgi:NitT/TauT family transport system ATP-binding protein